MSEREFFEDWKLSGKSDDFKKQIASQEQSSDYVANGRFGRLKF